MHRVAIDEQGYVDNNDDTVGLASTLLGDC